MADGGGLTDRGTELLSALRETVTGREPTPIREIDAHQATDDRVAAAEEARLGRGGSTGPTMPPLAWVGSPSGAVVVVGITFALQIQRSLRELVLAGILSALLAFLPYLVWYLDAPCARSLEGVSETFTEPAPTTAPVAGL